MNVQIWRSGDQVRIECGAETLSLMLVSEALEFADAIIAELRPIRKRAPNWAKGDDEMLRRLYAAGQPVRDIAQTLGRAETSVWNRISVLGIANRRPDAAASLRRYREAKRAANA